MSTEPIYRKNTCIVSVSAATVEWNQLKSVNAEVWDTGPLWCVWGPWDGSSGILFDIYVTYGEHGGLMGSDKMDVGGWTTLARQMNPGDIVDYDSMIGMEGPYFYYNERGATTVQCDYEAEFDAEGKIYLALSTIAWTGTGDEQVRYPAYGWVELALDPLAEPIVVSSAWDRDGGAMIVGGGAIPEPTSALLLAVGCAFLALRRKRYVA